jgi:uncharacterized membrane protein
LGVSFRLAVLLTIAAVFWSIVILTAPLGLRNAAMSGPSTLVYATASRICHQRTERSFAVAGVQMPVCARCSGLYLSGAFGALIGWHRRGRAAGRRIRTILFLAALPTAITFSLEFLGIAGFSNTARAVAALPLGAVAGWLFVQRLRYDARFDGNQILNG